MTYKEAVQVAIQLMDQVLLNGNDARTRGMAQAELMKSLDIVDAAFVREAKKKKA